MTTLLRHGVFLLSVAANTSRGKLQFRLKQNNRPILKNERYEKNLKYYIAKLQNKDDNLDKNIESGQKVYDKLKIECGKPIFKEKLEKSEAAIIEEAYYAICKENKNKFAVSLAPGKNQVIKSMGHGFRLLSQGNVEIATQHGDCNDNKLNIILVSDQGVNVINSAFYNNCKFDIIYEAWIKIDELYFYKKENVNQNEGGQILFRFKEYFPSTFNYRISIHQNN